MPNPKLLHEDETKRIREFLGLIDLHAAITGYDVHKAFQLANLPEQKRTQGEHGVSPRKRCRVASSS